MFQGKKNRSKKEDVSKAQLSLLSFSNDDHFKNKIKKRWCGGEEGRAGYNQSPF
jgi:hypothetical protein